MSRSASMWRSYISVGARSLAKNRTYAFITIGGLAIGMAACLLILLYIRYELSYDRWLPAAQNTYQFQTWFRSKETGQEDQLQIANLTAGVALKKDFPAVAGASYIYRAAPVLLQNGLASKGDDYLFTDSDFLSVVSLPILSGSSRALDGPAKAAITRSEALKRFGTADAVGRTFTMVTKGRRYEVRIGAVLADIPKNSQFKLDAIVRMDFPDYFRQQPQFLSCWGCQSGWVYVRLKPGTDPASLERALPAWEKRNIPDENSGKVHYNAGDEADWHLVNVREVHLGKAQTGSMTPGNDRTTLATFAIIALLILGMALVNFTNLATARASQRAREVALRKVLGASRTQLATQFIAESVLIAALAMLIALSLTELLEGPLSRFLDADIRVSYFGSEGIALQVLVLTVVVGILGGLYPALFLSRFEPTAVLKANMGSSETPGSGRLRNILVVGQFAVSIGLIICTAIIYAQTLYVRSVDPGYSRDHILQIDDLSRFQILLRGDQIVEAIRKIPEVDAAALSNIAIGSRDQNSSGVVSPEQKEPATIGTYTVDLGFKDTVGLRLLAGRWFDANNPLDDMTLPFPVTKEAQRELVHRGGNIVITRLAARRLGFETPAAAIGQRLQSATVDSELGLVPVTVVGVVEDPRFRTLKLPTEPMLFMNFRTGESQMLVRFHGDPARVRSRIEQVWHSFASDVPFTAKTSDELMRDLYKAEDARAKTFAAFALLSIIVGCLGLFGLAAFTAERRTKEIGIRKVLGASTSDIMRLLAWQFSQPVLIANLIAWPIAWLAMRSWLSSFDVRIGLGPLPFLLAGFAALAIAMATIGGHAFRVARANPIHALRYE